MNGWASNPRYHGTQAAGHTHVTIPFRYQIPRDERSSCDATFEKSSTDLPDGRAAQKSVQPSREKYSVSSKTQINLITSPVSSRMRGGSRSSRTLGWDAVDARAPGAQPRSQGGSMRPVSGSEARQTATLKIAEPPAVESVRPARWPRRTNFADCADARIGETVI